MRFNRTTSRYNFFDAKTQQPLLADDKDKKKNATQDEPKKDDSIDDDDTDLKHIDQSKGGYGHGTGFDKG